MMISDIPFVKHHNAGRYTFVKLWALSEFVETLLMTYPDKVMHVFSTNHFILLNIAFTIGSSIFPLLFWWESETTPCPAPELQCHTISTLSRNDVVNRGRSSIECFHIWLGIATSIKNCFCLLRPIINLIQVHKYTNNVKKRLASGQSSLILVFVFSLTLSGVCVTLAYL